MARYTTVIPDSVNKLLRRAAKRNRQSKEQFIQSLFESEADKESKKKPLDSNDE